MIELEYISELLKFTAIFFALFEILPFSKRESIEKFSNKHLRDFDYKSSIFLLLISSVIIWLLGNDGAFIIKLIGKIFFLLLFLSFVLSLFLVKESLSIDKFTLKWTFSLLFLLLIIGVFTPRVALEYISIPYNTLVDLTVSFKLPIERINILSLYDSFDTWVSNNNSQEGNLWYNKILFVIGEQILDGSILFLLIVLTVSITILLYYSVTSILVFPFWIGLKIAHKVKYLLSLEEKHGIPIFGFLLWASGEILGFVIKSYVYFS